MPAAVQEASCATFISLLVSYLTTESVNFLGLEVFLAPPTAWAARINLGPQKIEGHSMRHVKAKAVSFAAAEKISSIAPQNVLKSV